MKRVSREYLDAIKERIDIVEVGRELGLKLNKSTLDRYSCPCPHPNHKDQNPSFSLFSQSQEFHCFGCNCHGDIVDLVCLIMHVPFQGAIEYLSEKAGLEIEELDEDELPYAWEYDKFVDSGVTEQDMALFEMINLRDTLHELANRLGGDSAEFDMAFRDAEALIAKLDKATSPVMKSLISGKLRRLNDSIRTDYSEI